MNMDSVFRATAARTPDAPAILGPGEAEACTYAKLDAEIAATAAVLRQAGYGPGDAIGIHAPSGRGYVIATYAAWRIGACAVPLPMELTDSEKQTLLQTIHIDALVAAPTTSGASSDDSVPHHPCSFAAAYALGPAQPLPTGDALVRIASPCVHPAGFAAVDAAFIRFTSGTTGTAKGVVLSHRTIEERIAAANTVLGIGPDDRIVWLLSMAYHFTVSIVAYLSYGAAVILPRHHLAGEILRVARRHGATVIYASPTHYHWLVAADASANGDARPLPTLRLAISTTAPLPTGLGRRFRERFGVPLTQALGLIEIGLPFIDVDAPDGSDDAVGRLLPAYDLRLVDAGFGPQCREVLLAGPGFLDAYYAPWKTRAEIMPEGWFRTGDVGELDAAGRLILRGRAKDVINVMGMKVFPHEVEAVLASHPDVAEAVVTPAQDVRFGEVPVARVVMRGPVAPNAPVDRVLIDYCQRRLASYKVPMRIELVDSLAKTPSGKLLRRAYADPLRGADAR
jgi:long-chain acyl-CoA synthetase